VIFWDINSNYRKEKKRKIEQEDEMRFRRLESDIRYLFTMRQVIDYLQKEIESNRMSDLKGHNQLLDEIQSVTNFVKENFVEKKKKTSK
jgi:hypothetical protein